ncbi:MAG: helix-hairpin-helix domain-containing protein [Syntrophaceae bacterium]|nr:helix-hairpin-helix domain-containing protein [Syntrophaceae bacterium]
MRVLRMLRKILDIPLTESQREGSAALFLLAVAVLLVSRFMSPEPAPRAVLSGDERSGSVVAVVDGADGAAGVYFLPEGATRGDFGKRAGIPADAWRDGTNPDRALASGTVILWKGRASGEAPHFVSLDAPRRLALGLPVDVNRSTGEELALVPGIGPRTAEAILRFREQRGRIHRLEELKSIRGIKEKRLRKLRPYLAVLPEGRL